MSLPAIYFNFLLPQGCESFTVQHVLFKTLIELSVIEGPPHYIAGYFGVIRTRNSHQVIPEIKG